MRTESNIHVEDAPEEAPKRPLVALKGRGAVWNPPNRFEQIDFVADPDELGADEPGPRTVFLRDTTKSVLTRNDSPDVGFDVSLNPYRGCEHGCTGCEARSWIETQWSHRFLSGKRLRRNAAPPDGGSTVAENGRLQPSIRLRVGERPCGFVCGPVPRALGRWRTHVPERTRPGSGGWWDFPSGTGYSLVNRDLLNLFLCWSQVRWWAGLFEVGRRMGIMRRPCRLKVSPCRKLRTTPRFPPR